MNKLIKQDLDFSKKVLMRSLIVYELEFERSLKYAKDVISKYKFFQEFFKNFDFTTGAFFSVLPKNAYLDRIYDFDLNGIIPATDLCDEKQLLPNGEVYIPKCIFTARKELKFEVEKYLIQNQGSKVLVLRNQSLKRLESGLSLNKISNCLCRFSPYEPFFVLFQKKISKENFDQENELEQLFEKICISAYDGEAFLVWK